MLAQYVDALQSSKGSLTTSTLEAATVVFALCNISWAIVFLSRGTKQAVQAAWQLYHNLQDYFAPCQHEQDATPSPHISLRALSRPLLDSNARELESESLFSSAHDHEELLISDQEVLESRRDTEFATPRARSTDTVSLAADDHELFTPRAAQ